jgi:cytochrome bd-type quinol oxidase subunit 2
MPAGLGIFGIEWFTQIILPFILVFVLLFAILEKSKILGEDKTQINSILSLVLALIIIGVPVARKTITDVIPVIAVLAVILLLFMLIVGFVGYTQEGKLNRPLQIITAIIVFIVLVVVLLVSTGAISYLKNISKETWAGSLFQSLVFIIIIVIVLGIVLREGKSKEEE